MSTDPYKYFRIEARELLEQLGRDVLELERDGSTRELLPRLLRLAHTLKGAARVVKQRDIADLAHTLESHLEPLRQGAAPAREQLDSMLRLLDAASEKVSQLTPAPAATAQMPTVAEEAFRTLRTDVGEMDELLEGIAETQASVTGLRPALASLQHAERLASLLAEAGDARSPQPAVRAVDAPASDKSARTAQELRSFLATIGRGLNGGLERVDRELQQLRSAGERLRLLPAETLFGPLERCLRDAAQTLGKRARFRAHGGALRLDGHVLGALQPALIQIVRNALAHGIEPPEERLAAGKPAEGTVVLDVAQRAGRIVFVCRDDGRGIDLSAVRRALERKGVLAEQLRGAQPQELLQALLGSGVTTSSTLTEVSGRGIGLDVVRDVAASLGGLATLTTHAGAGTTVELEVPVTLSSLEALLVQAGTTTAAIPLSAVRQTLRVPAGDALGSASIAYDGHLVPFVALQQALGTAFRGANAPRAGARSAVVVGTPDGLAAIAVERLLGTADILVRPLPALAAADPVVASVSLDAQGDPRLVLDPAGLVASARRALHQPGATAPCAAPILVVDDSLTTRMLEQSILESAGYEVELATSGEEALEKARRRAYALLLVDVEMPGMDGFAVLEHMQASPELRNIPAILVTSRNAPEDRQRGVEVGARDYMVKSEFDQVALLHRIRGLIG